MKPLKVLSDLLPIPSYTVIILCFFFPFFLIKCGDTTLMSIKGTDLVTGISKKTMDKRMKESIKKSSPFASSLSNDNDEKSDDKSNEYAPMNNSKEEKGKDISPSPFIIISFLMAVAGITIHFIKGIRKKYLYHIIFSLIGLLGFLAFYTGFQAKMEDMGSNQLGMGLDSKITISYGFGSAFYIASVLYLVILMFFGIYFYFLKNNPEAIYGHLHQNSNL